MISYWRMKMSNGWLWGIAMFLQGTIRHLRYWVLYLEATNWLHCWPRTVVTQSIHVLVTSKKYQCNIMTCHCNSGTRDTVSVTVGTWQFTLSNTLTSLLSIVFILWLKFSYDRFWCVCVRRFSCFVTTLKFRLTGKFHDLYNLTMMKN